MTEGFALSPELLAYIAGGFYVAGLIITNQVILRIFLLSGTGIYVIYYWMIGTSPLWEAIYVSSLIALANIGGLTSLLLRRSRRAIPRAHADIYPHFAELPPGDFRALMKLARRYTVSTDTRITTEGTPGHALYFVINGATLVRKSNRAFALSNKIFIGEVAFLTGAPSSASVWLEEGTEVLEWRFDTLSRRCSRSARFKLALEAAISIDLAHKVARSMGAHSVEIERIPQPMLTALADTEKRA